MPQAGPTILQNAAAALGNGLPLNVAGMAVAVLQLTGTLTSLTVTFEASAQRPEDADSWVSIKGQDITAGTFSATATAAGVFRFNVAGLRAIRARVSTYVSGNVTVVGRAVDKGYAASA